MVRLFFWSPHIDPQVATVKSVYNSINSLSKHKKKAKITSTRTFQPVARRTKLSPNHLKILPKAKHISSEAIQTHIIDLVELGITKKLKGGNSVYATAYFRHVDNVINRVNTLAYEANGAVIDSIINRVYSNVGKSNSIIFSVPISSKIALVMYDFFGKAT